MLLTILKLIYQIVGEIYRSHHIIGLGIEDIRNFRQLVIRATECFQIIPTKEIFQSIFLFDTRNFCDIIIIQIHFHQPDFLAKRM